MCAISKRVTEEGWSGSPIIEEPAHFWNLFGQDHTLQALYAYGRIEPVEVEAAMAKHPVRDLPYGFNR